jgi:DNA modification methylase
VVRVHPAKKIELLSTAIREFGFTVPVILDENDVILAGHARVLAAQKLGIEKLPVVRLTGLSEARKQAYVLFDNKISEHSTYDWPAFADKSKDLAKLLSADGLDLELTGFNAAEFDRLASNLLDQSDDPDEALPAPCQEAVTRPGDIWVLHNKHRLLCDDSRTADYKRLMLGGTADMCFSDPPYNLNIPGVVGRGRTKHRNFVMAAGEMSRTDFTKFLAETHGRAGRYLADGALCYICMDWRHQREMLDAGHIVFNNGPIVLVVWVKTTPGQGSLYRSGHELIYVFKNGTGPHLNNVELGRYGRNRSNVWTYAGANSFGKHRMADLAAHPTTKPIMLVADAIKDCTRRNDIVLDPFMGSGTTILAAERVGRRSYGIEIDPLYVDTAVRRWITTYKSDVTLEGTDLTFEDVAADRLGGA